MASMARPVFDGRCPSLRPASLSGLGVTGTFLAATYTLELAGGGPPPPRNRVQSFQEVELETQRDTSRFSAVGNRRSLGFADLIQVASGPQKSPLRSKGTTLPSA